MKRTTLFAALAASAAVAVATGAWAQEAQMHVSLAGLDLKSDAGARSAMDRINSGALAFCSVGQGRFGLSVEFLVLKCRNDMREKAVSQLNAPRVMALYRQEGPTRPEADIRLSSR